MIAFVSLKPNLPGSQERRSLLQETEQKNKKQKRIRTLIKFVPLLPSLPCASINTPVSGRSCCKGRAPESCSAIGVCVCVFVARCCAFLLFIIYTVCAPRRAQRRLDLACLWGTISSGCITHNQKYLLSLGDCVSLRSLWNSGSLIQFVWPNFALCVKPRATWTRK